MSGVSVRELRDQCGDVLAAAGRRMSTSELSECRRTLPLVDGNLLRAEIDDVIDRSL